MASLVCPQVGVQVLEEVWGGVELGGQGEHCPLAKTFVKQMYLLANFLGSTQRAPSERAPSNFIGLPEKGVRKRGCNSQILRLFAFACVCSRLCTFICALGPFSGGLKFAFACVCLRLFAFANTPFYYTPLMRHPNFT